MTENILINLISLIKYVINSKRFPISFEWRGRKTPEFVLLYSYVVLADCALGWRLREHLEAPVLHDVHAVVNVLHQLQQQHRFFRGAEMSEWEVRKQKSVISGWEEIRKVRVRNNVIKLTWDPRLPRRSSWWRTHIPANINLVIMIIIIFVTTVNITYD